jgi:phosphoglucomutase
VHRHDYVTAYVDDLPVVIDLAAIRDGGLRLGVDPLGGASVAYWVALAERHGLDLTVVDDTVDPTFRFMPPTGTARSAWTARRRTRWRG